MTAQLGSDIAAVKRAYNEKDAYGWYDYDPLIGTLGNVIVKVDEDDYSGDSFVLFEENGRYSTLIFGWGSCSGCDALQACQSIEEVAELRAELRSEIVHHKSKRDLLLWLDARVSANEFYVRCTEWREFIEKVKEHVR